MIGFTPGDKLFQDTWELPHNPFPFLTADKYSEEQILSLFEIDRASTIRAFSSENSIIEGSYGTGKTMLLKAIYAFYYSRMIVDIAETKKAVVVPVYIKFSDLPHGSEDLYKELILHIYKRILDTRFEIMNFLEDSNWFTKFKNWLQRFTNSGIFFEDKRYSQLSAETVTERVNEIFKSAGAVGFNWLKQLKVAYETKYETEILKKPSPGILDIENLFESYFSSICKHLLLLIDEVDMLPTSAFSKSSSRNYSVYETILNHLKNSQPILYKVAVYPGSESSKQVEGSRIGTRIKLGFNVKDREDFSAARDFFYRILKSYLSFCAKQDVDPKNFFHIEFSDSPAQYSRRIKRVDKQDYGDALEQLVFGSNGIVRRFIKLAGDSMFEVIKRKNSDFTVSKSDIFEAMKNFGKELIDRLQENERALLDLIAFFCIQKNVFRYRVPGSEEVFYKLHDRTKQDNVLYPIPDQLASGSTNIFEFDYCYCLYRKIPTHFYLNAEKVSRSRSLVNGKWITTAADIPKNTINLDAKLDGEIKKYNHHGGWGFISYLENKDLFFHRINVIPLRDKEIKQGAKVSFKIGKNDKGECAIDIEVM